MVAKLTQFDFIQRVHAVHGDRYDYSYTRYINTHKTVSIICKDHGEFLQIAWNHLNGAGCPICAGSMRNITTKSNTSKFITAANIKHNSVYDYSKVNYTNSYSKVSIICNIHGEFIQEANSHLTGIGCPKCGITKSRDVSLIKYGVKYFNQLRVLDALPLLTNYDWMYTQYIINGDTAEQISVKLGVCILTVLNYLRKLHIPVNRYSNFSGKSILWLNHVMSSENIFIQHARNIGEYRVPSTKYTVDGYCKSTNTVYEFHGDMWHGNPNRYNATEFCNPFSRLTASELYTRTIEREEVIKKLGYNLVVMWELDYDFIKKEEVQCQLEKV